MTPFPTKGRRARALLAAVALVIAVPASTVGGQAHPNPADAYTQLAGTAPAGTFFVPLINSGQEFDGETFQGIPDGLGVVPVGNGKRFVDIYVAFEQSHVPFGTSSTTVFADFEDSSVQRARLDLKTRQIVELEEVLPASAGFIRFCSAFMAGPAEGFKDYTFFVNEESNDRLPTTPGVPNADPAISPLRQAGLTVWLDTATGEYKAVPGMGRHNHENQVIVPGGWDDVVAVSGDDTFSAPSSQLYMYLAKSPGALKQDKGSLWAFRVTDTDAESVGGAVVAANPFNDANDYLEINAGDNWAGEFILVPPGIAAGTQSYGLDGSGNPNAPQESLEAWSNAMNVFQFVRVEDIAYDPDETRTIYFADTGTDRLLESGTTGRLTRTGSTNYPYTNSDGRIFKMTFNEDDPRVVDGFSIVGQGRLRLRTGAATFGPDLDPNYIVGFANPDNLAVGHDSIMVQEDSSSGNGIWHYDFGTTWTLVASTLASHPADVETSGIIDMSAWMGDGWWAFDVQAHNRHVTLDPVSLNPADWYTWPLFIPGGQQYRKHLEDGQLLLMYVPNS